MSTVTEREYVAPPVSRPLDAPVENQRGYKALLWLRSALPTAIVIALLSGVAYWGHANDWRLPKFSTLVGSTAPVRKDWCSEHGVPESKCVECNPTLMPKGPEYGWCAEHGVSNCPLHHPDVAQLKSVPVINQADLARAARALEIRERTPNNSLCKSYQSRIQFASLAAAKEAGVDVELAERKKIVEQVSGNGEITYDQTRVANIASRASGSIWHVEKNVGDKVRAGELLAVVDAQAIGQAKSALIDALVQDSLQQKTTARLKGLPDGVVAGRKVLEAEAELDMSRVRVAGAQQTLANLGLNVNLEELASLPREEQVSHLLLLGLEGLAEPSRVISSNLLPIRSPIDGVLVDRSVTAGEVVDSSKPLFKIADTSRMWLVLNVPLEEAGRLSLGQAVRFRPDGTNKEVSGTLSWISTTTNHETRMLSVRAELPNPQGLLRDETFGAGEVVLREEPEAIVVPDSAIHWEGCCNVVFVRNKDYFASPESPKVFHVRQVRVGVKNGTFTEIISGILPGEVVATQGSDVLRAQLLKNSLGEGCTCGQ